MKHIVVIPAHNEAGYIGRTLQSLVDQTARPDRVIVVNDGSTDATADIVASFAEKHDWITMIQGQKTGTRQYRVVEVFNLGYQTVREVDFTYISKVDADLVFPTDYFARLFAVLDSDQTFGAGCGILYEVDDGGRQTRLRMPENHVPGALKTYRKRVFDEMGGFVPILGWDIIDLVKIRSLGYRTINLSDIRVLHLRRHAAATGILRGNMRMGHGAYVIGTHPLFALGRSLYRMLEPPYVLGGLALGYGYFRSWIKGAEQIPDRGVIDALRAEQLHRLFHFNRLPHRS